jgi:hypothetical protein
MTTRQQFRFSGESDSRPYFPITATSLDEAFVKGEEICRGRGEKLVSVNNIRVEFERMIKETAASTDYSDLIDH